MAKQAETRTRAAQRARRLLAAAARAKACQPEAARLPQVVTLPPDFLGLATTCAELILVDNPLDAAARERLTWLCSPGGASYRWDGGECDKCPRV